jgi:hypothetical protein
VALNSSVRVARGAAALGLLLVSVPASAAGGLLRVTSSGADGRVFIDGRDTGQASPATFDDVPFGKHQVAIDSQCARGAAIVEVKGPGASQVTVPMNAGTGTLIIHPSPAAARVTVDGAVAQGGESLTVSCGSHAVNVSLDDHLPAVLTLDVAMDEILELPVTLAALGKGTLVVTVSPEEADVVLDGDKIATGSVEGIEVVAGPHVLRVEADGYLPAERQFQLEDGGTRQLILALDKAQGPRGGRSATAGPGRGGRIAGWSLTGVGVGLVGYGVYAGLSTASAYNVYQDNFDDGDYEDQDAADDAYEDLVKPRRNAMIGGLSAGAALALTGVGLVIAF